MVRWPIAWACVCTVAVSGCESDRARSAGNPRGRSDGGGFDARGVDDRGLDAGGLDGDGVDGGGLDGADLDAGGLDVGSGSTGPALVYDGPIDTNARVPAWDANTPKPLITASVVSGGWFYGGPRIEADGAITNVSTSRVRVWVVEGMSMIYDGPLDANARVAGWNAIAPNPHLLMARIRDTQAWVVSGSSVDDNGLLGGLITDRVVVWNWSSDAPVLATDAMLGSAVISPWDASAPPPLVIFVRQNNNATWFTQLAEVDGGGVIGGVVADRARAWMFAAP